MNLFHNIGGSAGIAMVSTVLARREQFHQQILVSHLTPLDGGYTGIAQSIAGALTAQGISAADAVLRAQGVLYGMVQKSAAMLAVNDTFWILALVFLSMIPLVVLLKKTAPHKGAVIME